METLFYLILAAIAYVVVAETSDRAAERELRSREPVDGSRIRLVEDFDVRPAPHTWQHRVVRHRARGRARA
jgi:hypothetical protein